MNKKLISIFEITLMLLGTFAFAFIIGQSKSIFIIDEKEDNNFVNYILDNLRKPILPSVSANDYIPQGCCLEAKDGSVCQDIAQVDADLCKTNLVGTSCSTVTSCQPGCCFNPNEGLCSLNAPKDKCETNGGNWTSDPSCNIPQCEIGCCVLGDGASATTSRECTELSSEFGFEKNFQALDASGSCNAYTGLTNKGACVNEADDFSGDNNCVYTTKEQCAGSFYDGFLCTAKELNTNCLKTKDTTCIENSDRVYFVDSCGNTANIYDASRVDDDSYWEKPIEPEQSCQSGSASCGNCDYLEGSRCSAYETGKDDKPTYGDYVCRDLNCDNGKKNGESWCTSDYSNIGLGNDPVGSRFFKGSCVEGEITIEGCADFNQEVCYQLDSNGYSQAQCIVNDWRSCLDANNKDNYDDVKRECDKYEHCFMFSEEFEEYEDLPGFKKGILNVDQGRAGSVGDEANQVIAHCLPRYTPGMVFWTDVGLSAPTPPENSKQPQKESSLGYGSTYEETQAICAIGSFSCVTKFSKDDAFSDFEVAANGECLISEEPEQAQKWLQGLNERCRRLGPCGSTVSISGQLGSDPGYSVGQVKIDAEGDDKQVKPVGYDLTQEYLNALKGNAGITVSSKTTGSVILGFIIKTITGKVGEEGIIVTEAPAPTGGALGGTINTGSTSLLQPLPDITSQGTADAILSSTSTGQASTAAPQLRATASGLNIQPGPNIPSTPSGATLQAVGNVALSAALAAAAGYGLGQLIGKVGGLGSAETTSLSYALAATGASLVVGGALSYTGTATIAELGFTQFATACFGNPICIAGTVIVATLVYAFTFEEDKYTITTFSCEPWSPSEESSCDLCNNNAEPCSEYRCRSLGLHCNYYADNGEPGYCASISDTGWASIKPWPEALTEGNKYTNVQDLSFVIEDIENGPVDAWTALQFGVITSKSAVCKIDNKHTESYDDMANEMIRDYTGVTNPNEHQGEYHKIALSPYLGNSSGVGTLGLVSGEKNRFYIRCKNYAGSINEAEFVVDIEVKEGPDLTPPLITRFYPASDSYVKKGVNESSINAYVNEPSECRYSIGVDDDFKDMINMSCIIDPGLGFLGEWPCSTVLPIKPGENRYYFQCKDQPTLVEEGLIGRNLNPVSKVYILNSCETGLDITSISPTNDIITGSGNTQVELNVKTEGCIDGGVSQCSYSFDNSSFIPFFETNAKEHVQEFTTITSGDYNINIKCKDVAGNEAYGVSSFSILIDSDEPKVTRVYDLSGTLNLVTNEEAQCYYSFEGCGFEITNGTSMESNGMTHRTSLSTGKTYYIKCLDEYGNAPESCSIQVKQDGKALIKS